ncbi:uncharacterized protein YALI1_C12682g [Yarrowia lipolytica]|uniref:Uncharacterized protein n=1 Tax=Yarrowia lipolytica TaxID=4952 RepID=A0A1D8NAB8_YARLL|nr:hypothetical protein YALI1_C12682g [Yarrowia lipolytica]
MRYCAVPWRDLVAFSLGSSMLSLGSWASLPVCVSVTGRVRTRSLQQCDIAVWSLPPSTSLNLHVFLIAISTLVRLKDRDSTSTCTSVPHSTSRFVIVETLPFSAASTVPLILTSLGCSLELCHEWWTCSIWRTTQLHRSYETVADITENEETQQRQVH